MTEHIFNELAAEYGEIVHHGRHDLAAARRIWNDILSVTISHNTAPRGPAMSVLTDVETKIHDVLTDVTGKLQELVTSAPPVIHDGAEALARLSSSKIVVELEQLAQPIDPALEELVAGMIRTAGAAADKIAAMVPAAPAEPAEPAPAPAAGDPQIQTGIAV